MPNAYPFLTGYAAAGIRRRIHRDYLILYRVVRRTVEVLRILHGARDYEHLLNVDRDDSA